MNLLTPLQSGIKSLFQTAVTGTIAGSTIIAGFAGLQASGDNGPASAGQKFGHYLKEDFGYVAEGISSVAGYLRDVALEQSTQGMKFIYDAGKRVAQP